MTAASQLQFDFLRRVEEEVSDTYDQTEVAVSIAGSDTWTTVWSRDSTDPSQNAWTASGAISLAAWAGETIQVRFRFDSVDEQANDFLGWMVDDVRVTGESAGGDDEPLFSDGFESGDLSAWSSSSGGP